MYEVKLDQAKSILSALVRAAIEGERVFIFQDDQQVVQLVPVTPLTRHIYRQPA